VDEARGTSIWREWKPPADWPRVLTVDAHAEGEPLRVILSGFPLPDQGTILDRRRYARAELDSLRTALMWEPRGHADMYGCILTAPVSHDAHFGVLFTHNEGYSTMCGHGIIAVTTVVLELGLFEAAAPVTELRIDTPAGLVSARAHVRAGRVNHVSFRNVPSYVVDLDATVHVPGLGVVRYDLAFGGAFYAYVEAGPLGLELNPWNARSLIDVGMSIKRAVMASRAIGHPLHDDLGFLYGTIFIGPAQLSDAHSRNVCIFAEGEVDRSPTGTGVSGRVAIHYARGEIARDQPLVFESIIGSRFTGKVVGETVVGPFDAVIPEVAGRAWITGRNEFVIDPSDPLGDGFLVR
jgi:trans-L-3-hydroxyproline dehydratase